MLSLIKPKNSINSVCILYPVCNLHFVPSLHFVRGLQSPFCTDRISIAVFVWASLKSGPKYWVSKKNFSEAILAATIDVWAVYWRAPEDKHNDRAMITLYQMKTNTNAQLNNKAASNTPLRGHNVCWNEPATGLSVNISASKFKLPFRKFGNVIYWYYFH